MIINSLLMILTIKLYNANIISSSENSGKMQDDFNRLSIWCCTNSLKLKTYCLKTIKISVPTHG